MSQTVEPSRVALSTPDAVREFMLAGNAILTLRSRKTDAHYTYRVKKADRGELWFVSLLTGPENTSDYTYIGVLRPTNDEQVGFQLTKKSHLPEAAPPIAGVRFLLRAVQAYNEMPKDMDVMHEGRCGRCGRVLTVPESLERGIGPECAKHQH